MVDSNPDNQTWHQMKQKLTCRKFDPVWWSLFEEKLKEAVDIQTGKIVNNRYWDTLFIELRRAAHIQTITQKTVGNSPQDSFETYAAVYDEVVGKPSLNSFMANYIRFFSQKYQIDYSKATLLSIGCGTGLVEDHIITTLGMPKQNLLGIDISEAMIKVASERINSKVANIVNFEAPKLWDLTYSGLNSFQYLQPSDFRTAIENTAQATKPNGYFFGDFITPDHIRQYSNVGWAANNQVISLRQPKLIEQDNYLFQASEIINVNRLAGELRITHEGTHKRYLPPIIQVYSLFKEIFKGQVDLFDAVSLEPLDYHKETCLSTRYLVIVHKAI